MAKYLHSLKRLTLLISLFLCTGILSAQTDFLFVVDNSGSISPSEFDAFADIIMETGNALDQNCTPSNYAIVHYGGAFGQEYTIQNDFIGWSSTSTVNRIYQDCVTSGTPDCGDDLFAAFGSIDAEIGTGLNLTTGSTLIVVIFTDADGMSQGMNNMSPCSFSACSTILPSTNFTTFMDSQVGSSGYVVGVEDTDNEGLLQQYLYGDGSYLPIDLDDDPLTVASTISSSIDCASPLMGMAKNLTSLDDNMDGTYTVEYLLTVENFSPFDLTTIEVLDDITTQFSGYMPTNFMAINGSLNANIGWNGTATSNIAATGQTLAMNAIETISVKFDITHNGLEGTINNNASVNGTSPSGMVVSDTSTDGLNTDPDDDDIPDELVPTPIMLPEVAAIGLAKDFTGLTNNNDGTYTVAYLLTVENLSLIPMSDLRIYDDIVGQFSGYSPSAFSTTNGTLSGSGSWNGTSASNILVAGQTIVAGAMETVTISFDIVHDGMSATVNNIATVKADTPADNELCDTSTDGVNPDPDGNGDPEEEVPTPLKLPEIADLGLAKNLTSLTDNNNGTYTIEYLLTAENFSMIPLTNMSIVDDIISQFSGYSPTNFMATNGSFTASNSWNGNVTSNVLAAGQNLAAGQTKTVSISFDITHNGMAGTIENLATVSGTTPTNQTISDTSTDGLNPDPDGNDVPDEMIPTPVALPEVAAIGLAKDFTSLTNNNNGTYTATFLLTVENLSLITLSSLEIYDDIVSQFSGYSPSGFSTTNGTLNGSGSWNGTAGSNILTAGQTIAAGASETVSISFDLIHDGMAATIDNIATLKADTPANNELNDTSTDGLNPDPDGNGNPDEEIPTPLMLPEIADLGLAKNLTSLTDNNNGTYTIEYLLTAENFSMIPLTNMSIADDIITQFSGYSPTNFVATNGSFTASSSWSGNATSNILGAGQNLAAGETKTVSIKFDITHNGMANTIENLATVSGTTPTNQTISDTSTDGINPDPDGNDIPDEMTPTPVTLPEIAAIGLAKDFTSLTNNNDGTYTVRYLLTVENMSLIPFTNLRVYDDIVGQFAAYMPSNFMVVNGSLNGSINWNGTSGSNILTTGQTIAAGAIETVTIEFDIVHNGISATVNNIATVKADTPAGSLLCDTSTDGVNPDPDNNGDPEEEVPTPLVLPEKADLGLAKNLTSLTDNNDGTYTIEFLFTAENFSMIPLTNISIADDIITQFAAYSPSNFQAISGSLNASGTWNGTALSNTVALGQSLAAGESKTISIQFDIVHNGLENTVLNSAQIGGTTPTNQVITDTSTDGLNPDPDGNNTPDEMIPTPVTLPEIAKIGIAKNLSSLINNNNGTFTVEYLLTVENMSLISLSNLEIVDDIITRFAVVSPSNYTAISGTLNASSSWNGTLTSNILAAGQTLNGGEVKTVSIKFDLIHDGLERTIDNHSIVTGTTPTGATVMDISTDGMDPDPNNNNDPEEEEPTEMKLPELGAIGLAKNLTSLTANVDNSYTVEFLLTIENFALFSMSNLEVLDDIATQFGGYSPSNFMTINGTLNGSSIWDGTSASNILASGQSIAAGAVETVSIKFDLIPSGIMTTLYNRATVTGSSPSGTIYMDDSYNGLDPDPDGNGDPEEEMPTPVVLPMFGMVSGTVWKDANADGLNNNNELGLFWVMVELVDCNGGVIASGFSDQDGNYTFSNVPPGNYMLNFDTDLLPAGCEFTLPNVGTNEAIDSDVDEDGSTGCFPIAIDDDLDYDAGLYQLGTIGDRVWHDLNGDGVQNFGEPGLNGIQVILYDATNTPIRMAVTSGNGNYYFENLLPGFYYVQYNVGDDFHPTTSFAGSNQTTDSNVDESFGPGTTPLFELIPGEVELDVDGGFYQNTLIGETVFFDSNKNNIFDSNENGINGMPVELWQIVNGQQIKVAEQLTHHKPGTPSDDGYFKFNVPPGEYFLKMDIPALGLVTVVKNAQGGLPLTHPNEPTTDSDVNSANITDTFQINSGEEICNIGAGYYPMATIGNRTWADSNHDGLQDTSEPALAGVQINAYNSAGVMIDSDVSAADGSYMIDYLGQDDYFLEFTPPDGYSVTVPNAGAENRDSDVDNSNGPMTTSTYGLNSGDNLENVDAGFVLSVVPVVWMSFTGEARGEDNMLDWSTASEINASHFYVERSVNGVEFEDIGRVEASGNSNEVNNYQFADRNVYGQEIYYYQLRQVDFNGNYSYSDVISIRRKSALDKISIYPIPVQDELNLEFNLLTDTKVSLALYDAQGKLITNLLNTELSRGSTVKSVDLNSLSAGTYLVQGTVGTESYSKKLIVL